MKLFGRVLALAALGLLAVSCEKEVAEDNRVALFLPDSKQIDRWGSDMANLVDAMKKYGLEPIQHTASENAEGAALQAKQIESEIRNGIKTLVITPIDAKDLNNRGVFDGHKDLKIICHDRIIPLNPKINCCSSCQREQVGVIQAQFLIHQYKASGKETMNLEMFAGPKSDDNASYFFKGAFDLLKPYIDGGQLIVRSGKISYDDVAVNQWSKEEGSAQFLSRLQQGNYESGQYPDLILSPNDALACGIIEALDGMEVTSYPAITGQDNSDDARRLIYDGKMSMTIDKSLQAMAYNTALVTSSLKNGVTPLTTEVADKGLIKVPLITSQLTLVTKDNLSLTGTMPE